MIAIRPYQSEAIQAVRQDWKELDRVLVVACTGSGKTVIFLSLLEQLLQSGELKRALILADQRDLIYQPFERAQEFFPDLALRMGIVMADQDDASAQIVIATIQTLSSEKRWERVIRYGGFSHIIVDEAHGSTAPTWQKLFNRNPGVKVAGFTATPLRSDGDGLVRVFQKVSYRYPISKGIRDGSLVPFDALGVGLPISFSQIEETEDGWDDEQMGDVLKAENVLQIVYDNWKQYAGNRLTIGYTASVAQARRTAEFFRTKGVNAEWICGETPHDERRRITNDFRAGKIQCVFNMMVWTKGVDFPEASSILMIAPTKSDLVYVQRLGRGLRTFPGKSDCRVLDFAPIDGRNVIMAGDVLGKPREVKKAEEKAERAGVLFAVSVDQLGHATSIDPTRLIVKVLNLLRKDALAWALDGRYATASLGAKSSLCIELPDLPRIEKAEQFRRENPERWTDRHEAEYRKISQYGLFLVENNRACFQGRFTTLEDAKAAGDDLALDRLEGVLSEKKSHWRKDPPSEKQLDLLRRFGATIPERCTKGQAAQLITQAMTISAVRRVRV
jgi:superfamily II DNA or RNA helicase